MQKYLFSILVLIAACGNPSPHDVINAKARCALVTNDNWRQESWEISKKTSKHICEERILFVGAKKLDTKEFGPCTFGGLPYFCTGGSKSIMIEHPISAHLAAIVNHADFPRTAPHITMLFTHK